MPDVMVPDVSIPPFAVNLPDVIVKLPNGLVISFVLIFPKELTLT